MQNYALWSNIDMVMNEAVTQRALRLITRMDAYRSDPNEQHLEALNIA
jgi:hypothetical protein